MVPPQSVRAKPRRDGSGGRLTAAWATPGRAGAALDLAAVLLFVGIGPLVHAHGLGLASTTWPFLSGLVARLAPAGSLPAPPRASSPVG